MPKYNFRDFAAIDVNQPIMAYQPEPRPAPVSANPEFDALLSIIYGLDDVTHLPTSDLSMYMSTKCSPEIRQFILDNLRADVSGSANHVDTRGLSSDEIFALSRQHNESRNDYLGRIANFVRDTDNYVLRMNELQSKQPDSNQ